MPDTALVTGGTGFTGSHLVRALLQRGDQVRVLARNADRARRALPEGADVVIGDIADDRAVDRAATGCTVAYHLAAAFREAGIPDSHYREVHVEGTRLVLEAARSHGFRRVVHCSTIGVHGHISDPPGHEQTPHRPGDIYQTTKSEGERLALELGRASGVPVAVARPASIYGPGDRRLLKLFRLIARRRFVMLGSGEVGFHTVYVDDLVKGLLLLADREEAVGEAFILAGEESTTLNELVRLIARTLGVPPPRVRLPVAPIMAAAHVVKAVCVPLRIEPPLFPRRVAFFTKHREFTIDKARRMVGYEPEVPLVEGIRRTAEWYVREELLSNARLPRGPTAVPTGVD